MWFLMMKILFPLIAATALGVILGIWMGRRGWEDVTETYQSQSVGADPRIDTVLERLDSLADTARFDRIDASISQISSRPSGAVDLGPLDARLGRLEAQLEGLKMPDRGAFEAQLAGLKMPALSSIDARLESLAHRLDGLGAVDGQGSTDLSGVLSSIAGVSSTVAALKTPDLGPVRSRLSAIEARLDSLGTVADGPDLSGILSSIEARLDALQTATAAPPPPAPPSLDTARRTPGRNLLTGPQFGTPDDLTVISGIGPKLERMLHDIGVYYFWQVSQWTPDDVTYVDEQLEVFKGRITRDGWVTQAGRLVLGDGAANEP